MAHMYDCSAGVPMAPTFSDEERMYLAQVARLAITKGLHGEAIPDIENLSVTMTEALMEPRGVYVTLMRHKRLRGSSGLHKILVPLYTGVARMAFAAAFGDRRFIPLDTAEWPDMQIEISILGNMFPCLSLEQIVLGEHGLMLEKDGHSALLLPQTPIEQLWDTPTFVSNVHIKRGLVWDKKEIFDSSLWYFRTQNFSVPSLEKS